jgi:uncharacterized protein (TIGR02246 family)
MAYAAAIIVATVLPVSAQNLTEQQARGVVQALVDEFNLNYKAKNAAGLAATFTEDTIRVWSSGAVSASRAEIEKRYANVLERFESSLIFDQIKIVSNNVIVVFGSYSGTLQSKDGPVNERGRWTWTITEARSGEGWKIAASMLSTQQ